MNRNKSSIFLMELIIAIGFFAMVSAVSMQAFAAARNMSMESVSLQRAVIHSTSAKAVFRASQGDLDQVASLMGGQIHGNTLTLEFSEHWELADDPALVRYQLQLTNLTLEPTMLMAAITVTNLATDNILYHIPVHLYLGVERRIGGISWAD